MPTDAKEGARERETEREGGTSERALSKQTVAPLAASAIWADPIYLPRCLSLTITVFPSPSSPLLSI